VPDGQDEDASVDAAAVFSVSPLRSQQLGAAIYQATSLWTWDARRALLLRFARVAQLGDFDRRMGEGQDDLEVPDEETLSERLHLMNGALVRERTKDDDIFSPAARLPLLAPTDAVAVDVAFLMALTRHATPDEGRALAGAARRRRAPARGRAHGRHGRPDVGVAEHHRACYQALSVTTPAPEPLRSTLARTVTIALVVGAVLARSSGGLARWPLATVMVLWPSFGGHWVELWFLDWLRPRLPGARAAQVGARVAVWYVGGTGLALGMALDRDGAGRAPAQRWPAWWLGGLGFIGVELVAHLALRLLGRPSFYDGRG